MKTQRGATIIELLIVIAVISMIIGVSSAFFSNLDQRLLLKLTTGQIASLLKSAQNSSLQSNSTTVLDIYKDYSILELWTNKIVGLWHFEDNVTTGALGKNGELNNVSLIAGKIGKCFYFTKGNSSINFGSFKKFQINKGFEISLWIYPERNDQEQILWEVENNYRLGINIDYTLYIKYPPDKTTTFHEYTLPLYQWSLIQLKHVKNKLSLFVNDIKIGEKKSNYSNFGIDSPMIIGKNFQGKIDEVKLLSKVLATSFELPDSIYIQTSPSQIIFNRYGLLDSSSHSDKVDIILRQSGSEDRSNIMIAFGKISKFFK